MSGFSEELGKRIHERGIAVYELAKLSGVDRTLIHKMTKGERIPAQQSVVEALAGTLMLSTDQRENLLESYRAAKMGEEVYRRRRAVLDFYNGFPPSASSGIIQEDETAPSYILPQEAAVRGKTDVGRLVLAVLEEEAALPEGRVRIFAQPDCTVLFDLLAAVAARRNHLTIDHIMRFENSMEGKNPLYNLRCLSAVMPVLASGCLYRPRYFYGPAASWGTEDGILPYVVATGRYVVRLSHDASSAVMMRNQASLALYQELFEELMEKAVPLAGVFRTPMEQIHYITHMYDRFDSMNSDLAAQPCLLLFVGQDMVRRYVDPVFLKTPEDMNAILSYMDSDAFGRRLKNLTRVYFSREGIEEFLTTGRLHELPDYYYAPLAVPDRYRLLRGMYEAILAGTYRAVMVNRKKLRIPNNLGTYFFQNGGVGFIYTGSDRQYTAVAVSETSIVTAIQDFLEYLPESNLVETQETMMEFLKGKLAEEPQEKPVNLFDAG